MVRVASHQKFTVQASYKNLTPEFEQIQAHVSTAASSLHLLSNDLDFIAISYDLLTFRLIAKMQAEFHHSLKFKLLEMSSWMILGPKKEGIYG